MPDPPTALSSGKPARQPAPGMFSVTIAATLPESAVSDEGRAAPRRSPRRPRWAARSSADRTCRRGCLAALRQALCTNGARSRLRRRLQQTASDAQLRRAIDLPSHRHRHILLILTQRVHPVRSIRARFTAGNCERPALSESSSEASRAELETPDETAFSCPSKDYLKNRDEAFNRYRDRSGINFRGSNGSHDSE